MNRRGFLLTVGAAPAALDSVVSAAHERLAQDGNGRQAEPSGNLTLSSNELEWPFEWRGRKLSSTHFKSRLSGKTFNLSQVREVELIFSASKHRVEIPWW